MEDDALRCLCDGVVNNQCGYVIGPRVEKVLEVILQFERSTTTKYNVIRSTPNFGTTDMATKPHCVQWEHSDRNGAGSIPFDGVPFMVLGAKVLECHHGPDRNILKKAKYAERTKDSVTIKHRFLKRDTKKLGCTAKIWVCEVMKFPEFKIAVSTKKARDRGSKSLRDAISNSDGQSPSSPVSCERRLYICLPSDDDHSGHTLGEMGGVFQPVDSEVVKKIYELVGQGVRTVSEMRRHVRIFVENEMFRNKTAPIRSNRRFFPSLTTIKNHMYNATVKQRVSVMDQENVQSLAEKWQAEGDHVKFRPFMADDENVQTNCAMENVVESDEDCEDSIITHGNSLSRRLLFVHQTPWQQRLLLRYGQEIAFLDATYKTTKYALPVYFLAVKTNASYIVVAEFVIQDETTESIAEALSVLKGWNPQWRPKNVITDLCEEEINAVEQVLPDSTVLICAFHREQAWERWTSKKDNGVSSTKDAVLTKLRKIANSQSEEALKVAIEELQISKEYVEHANLRKWFNGTWMKHKERWVGVYRNQRLLVHVNTNNGLERQNGVFKHQYIQTLRKHSLGGMLRILRDEYLPDRFERYIDANSICSGKGRRYNSQIPEYLHHRPDYFVDHCMKRLESSMEINIQSIRQQELEEPTGCFCVASAGQMMTTYTVCFRNPKLAGFPSCECQDWMRWYLPCKHMLAILQTGRWTWGQICEEYRESPFLTLDEEILFTCVSKTSVTDETGDISENEPVATPTSPRQQPSVSTTNAPSKSQITVCCDLWASIKNLMYESTDASAVARLEHDLRTAKNNLERSLDKENGIILTKTETCRRKLKKRKKILPPLKVKRTGKHPFSQRHGSKAAMMRRMLRSRLSLNEMLKQSEVSVKSCSHTEVAEVIDIENPAEVAMEIEIQDMSSCTEGSCTPTQIFPSPSHSTTSQKATKVSDFTPPLSVGLTRERRLLDPLLVFGPIKCNLLQIKSLEPTLTNGMLSVLKSVDPDFTTGWLYDNIIDAYFWCLKHNNPEKTVQVITAAVMMVLQHGLPSSRVWRGEDLTDVDWVFAPWNPAGNHWTLVAVNIKERKIMYLNPLHKTHQVYTDLLLEFFLPFLARFGWENFTVVSLNHTLQKDSRSCGVFTCWYARQLLYAQPLTDFLDANVMRVEIYRTITGDCLQRLCATGTRLSQCGICRDSTHNNDMAQCTKCKQWHHLSCLGISVQEARKRKILHCPPSRD